MSAVHKGKKAVQANGQLRYSAKHMVTGALVDACVDARWDFSIATVLAKLVSAREKDDPESLKLTSIYMAMLLLVPQQNRSVFSSNKLINVWKVDTVVGKGTDEGGHCIKPARLVITVPDLVWLADAIEQYLYDEYGADTGDYRLNLKKIVDPLKHLVEQDHGSTITREKIINIASDRDETKAREFLQQVGNSIDTRKREREHEESIREAKQLRAALDARYNHVGGEHDVCPSCGLAGQVRYRFLEGYDQSDCRKTEVWGGSTEMHSTGPRKEAKCANCDNVWTFDD
ncbi:hypothetical protein Pmar_PMAR006758 [Perkinsus marinus ATCC 50983]|uniref:Uncharacterized protein n=1 Tax=Perkinsus marinus (strain ATCC 50983 / TXsc) TaxID=423536 RepID=C5K6E6_PERM5|nr:hypothetical protein Pmar_PMAR006758 [Perkinsus marinus ATCC 50983]EER19866.1 hypothetical protein Pmar_PMAR006758 [Perkinsus marinus ATCC 50983]|eukprot:XP_002788070.1 hypothetical protein Pmar_PMAR006758 [Perkinsus marinus ATCC 50983]